MFDKRAELDKQGEVRFPAGHDPIPARDFLRQLRESPESLSDRILACLQMVEPFIKPRVTLNAEQQEQTRAILLGISESIVNLNIPRDDGSVASAPINVYPAMLAFITMLNSTQGMNEPSPSLDSLPRIRLEELESESGQEPSR